MSADTIEKTSLTDKKTKDLTVGKPAKNIINFTIPVMLGAFFQLAYSWTDAIIVGKVDGAEAFSALTATSPIIFLFFSLTVGFMTGAAVVLGQLFGSKDFQNLRKAQTTIIICMLAACAILMVSGLFLSVPLLRLLNVSDTFIDMSAGYLKVYFLGILTMALYNTFAQTLHSVGNSRVPLIALIISALTNIALDLLFVRVLHLGIVGAAIATLIAQGISATILFVYIQVKVPILRIKKLEFDKVLFKKTVKLAFPSMIQQVCAAIGFIAVYSLINSHGDEFTTAFGLVNRIDELMSVVVQSFSAALTAFSAQNKGVGEINRIKNGLWNSYWMCSAILLFLGSMVIIFRENLIGLFMDTSPKPDQTLDLTRVVELTSTFLSIMIPSFLLVMVMLLTSGVMRGSGAAIDAMGVNVISLIMRIVAAFSFNALFGYFGLFFATPAAWFAGAVMAIITYSRKKWTKVNSVVPTGVVLQSLETASVAVADGQDLTPSAPEAAKQDSYNVTEAADVQDLTSAMIEAASISVE